MVAARYLLALVFILALHAGAPAQTPNLQQRLDGMADAVESKVIAWRRDIHANPELGFEEIRTAALVANHLKSLGMEVRTGVGITGVVGILRGARPGPMIAFRADMDALPITEETDVPFASKVQAMWRGKPSGVMHACGHDAHVAILMGTAEILAQMKNDLAGSVMFIFQPAEEGSQKPGQTGGGAKAMLEAGLFREEKPSVVFGLHVGTAPVGALRYRAREMSASSDGFRIVVKGKGTHGARPWDGVDPIVTAAQIVVGLQTVASRMVDVTRSAVVVTVGAINGGNRANIIPDEVEMIGTIRTFDAEVQKKTHEAIKQVAEGIAQAAGARAEVRIGIGYPIVFNDPAATEASAKVLERVFERANITVMRSPLTGGEDFSYFAQQVPGFFFGIGISPRGADPRTIAPNHSPRFYIDESGLKYGVRAFVSLAFDRIGAKE
jgi:amidohydrolase